MKTQATTHHAPRLMAQVPRSQHYSNKNHSAEFACPGCGKTQRRNLNFLGQRKPFCDGVTVALVPRDEWFNAPDLLEQVRPTHAEAV